MKSAFGLKGVLGTIFGVHESYGTPQVGSVVAYESDRELRLSVSGQYHRILTGGEWLTRIRGLGYGVSDEAAFVLNRNYIPYKRMNSDVFSVLRGKTTAEVMATAKCGHYMEPHFAVACILREVLFDHWLRDYGLSALVIEHFPVRDSTGSLCKLALYRGEGGQGWLDVYYGNPRGDVESGVGFVFVLP